MPTAEPAEVTAIVVVHHVDRTATARSVQSLVRSTGVRMHVVVAFNGAMRELKLLRELVSAPGVALVECGSNRGFAAAVNLAARHVPAHHHVFLLNDDAWVDPAAVATCVATLAAAGPRCVSVAPLVVHADDASVVDSIGVVLRPNGEAFNAHIGRPTATLAPTPAPVLGPSFAAALFRPGAFQRPGVGPLDERFFLYYEDVEWNVRARHHGWHSISAPDAIAHHQHALSTRRLGEARRYRMVQRNLLVFATTALSWRSVGRVWLGRLAAHAKGVITGPYRADRVLALGAALARVPGAVAARRATRGGKPVPDADLFTFSEGMSPGFGTGLYGPV